MLLEQLERRVLADRSAVLTASFTRGQELDLPNVADAQRELDEMLAAEPRVVESVDSQQFRMRAALGVA